MQLLRPVRVALPAAALVAAIALNVPPANAVTGPPTTDTASSYAFTTRLDIGTGDTERACSGALVAPRWVLTAASCFVADPAAGLDVPTGPPTAKTTATIGRADLTTTAGQVRTVVKLVPESGQDLVLAELASPVAGIAPVALSTTAPVAGEQLQVAGYGRTKDEWVPLNLHTGTFGVDTVAAGEIDITGQDGAAVCKGDSGGPLLRESGGAVQLVGINSRSWGGGCFGADPSETRTGAVDTRVDTVGAWVSATVADPALPPRHDYNGDGRSDIGVWYDYTDGSDALHTFVANPDGSFAAPMESYSAPATTWQHISNMKFATGDYNGDGLGDVVILYGYEEGTVKIFTALGRPDGGFNAPVASWSAPSGSWDFDNMLLQSGDFNGDGRDDLAVWYSLADTTHALYTFTSTAQGGFNAPFSAWTGPAAHTWTTVQCAFVTGDFNGDGRDDLALLYGYLDGHVQMHTFLSQPTGAFSSPVPSWASSTWGSFARTHLQAGDFNGDGIDDVAFWYDYADGHDDLMTLAASSDGKFAAPVIAWTAATGLFTYQNVHLITGDYNGDGMDDVAALYDDTTDGKRKLITWTAKADHTGKFNGALTSWTSTTGSWNPDRAHILNRYN
ncbi:FG-GAP-like repeat-containing protein [Streptomyces sp. NRRL F-5123]|uniref:FG-GAP-like repeat-containing protein n=1 Tax=Streptomyces sp. NRRL F-5123 TaxID=1463856 RepID=UPI0004E0F1E1|nr:FG-GAP-like repeat-containing protein [Streptomyces sp. NRRL F-5123]